MQRSQWIIHLLQQGIKRILTCVLFKWSVLPYLRQGFVLALPSVTIEVAEPNAVAIRSSNIALFITCLLVAHLYLRTPVEKFWLFLLLVFPLTVVTTCGFE